MFIQYMQEINVWCHTIHLSLAPCVFTKYAPPAFICVVCLYVLCCFMPPVLYCVFIDVFYICCYVCLHSLYHSLPEAHGLRTLKIGRWLWISIRCTFPAGIQNVSIFYLFLHISLNYIMFKFPIHCNVIDWDVLF